MKFDSKGIQATSSSIADFIAMLGNVDANQIWLYNGLEVVIDPTVDYASNNVLVRWEDIEEGFNDRKIYSSLIEFQRDFIATEKIHFSKV